MSSAPSKDGRIAEMRRRDRPGELESATAAPTMKKTPGFAIATENTQQRKSEEPSTKGDDDDEAESLATSSASSQVDMGGVASAASSPPIVPKLSPSIHVRTSSLGLPSRSLDSPRLTPRRHVPNIRHDRRESLLGRQHPSGSPPGSPRGGLSSSFREHSAPAQSFLELDTDSDDDSPFPPPISYTEQVSHARNVPVALRVRQTAGVPINNSHTRRMLSGIRERRILQERSSTMSDSSPSNYSPPSPGPNNARQLVYLLERGGVVVGTSLGPIQFGIPPKRSRILFL